MLQEEEETETDCDRLIVEEGQREGERDSLVDLVKEVVALAQGVVVAQLEEDKEALVVPLPQLLPLGLGDRDSHSVVEAVAHKVGLGLCVTLWLAERLLMSVLLTESVPLLQ